MIVNKVEPILPTTPPPLLLKQPQAHIKLTEILQLLEVHWQQNQCQYLPDLSSGLNSSLPTTGKQLSERF